MLAEGKRAEVEAGISLDVPKLPAFALPRKRHIAVEVLA